MNRESNIKVFEDTEKQCKLNRTLRSSIEVAKKKQFLLLENDKLIFDENHKYEEPCEVVVSTKRSIEAAMFYRKKGIKTCVHNFASHSNPGGGVVRGARAQEECICRCTTLYFCLNTASLLDGFYKPYRRINNPIGNGDLIYTPVVVVFKEDTDVPVSLKEEDWEEIDVITMAAPNLRHIVSDGYGMDENAGVILMEDDKLQEIHEKRMRRFMEVAKQMGDEAVILGAFGCGAFCNNPKAVAMAMKNIVQEYKYDFKYIEFAVYCSDDEKENYEIFKNVIG